MLQILVRKLRLLSGVQPSMKDRIRELRSLGMVIGKGCHIAPDAEIELPWATHLKLGSEVTVARGVRFISHDACMWRSMGASRVGVIEVGDRAFIGAFTIVMPNVRIGAETIIAAGSVVTKDIPAGVVAAGNPARVIKTISELHEKTKTKLARTPCFGEEYRMKCGGTVAMRNSMLKDSPNGECFIVSKDLLRADQLAAEGDSQV